MGRGKGRGRGFVAPCPLLLLEEEDPGSRVLLVGVGVLGVGGFGHLLHRGGQGGLAQGHAVHGR